MKTYRVSGISSESRVLRISSLSLEVGILVLGLLLGWWMMRPSWIWGAEVGASNSNTGAESENSAQVEVVQETRVEQTNSSSVNNQVSFQSNTGGNQASENTGNGEVFSGGITTNTGITNQGSSNVVSTSPSTSNSGSATAMNSNTGVDSNNQANVEVNQNTQVVVSNSSDVVNSVDISANTGKNQANGNTGEGVVVTGEISSGVGLSTEAGSTSVKVCQGCGFSANVKVINENTGAGSENVSGVAVNNTKTVDINQESKVNNQVTGSFDTGGNSASGNTEGGWIITGGINVTVGINNLVNKAVVLLESEGCCDGDDPEDPGDPGDPETGGPEEPNPPSDNPGSSSGTSGSGSSSSGGSSGGGSVAAASIGPAIGAILPATGAKLWLWWMAGMFLFSMGRFVRLVAGRSPAEVQVEA